VADFPVLGVEPVTNPGLHSPLRVLLHFSDTDQRIALAGRKQCSETNRRARSEESSAGWASERRPPEASCGQLRAEGKIDLSREISGAGDTRAGGCNDPQALLRRDSVHIGDWRCDAAGNELFPGRGRCNNSALGRSGDRSRTACRRCGKSADVKGLRSWPQPSRLAGGTGQRRPIMAG
jgi:hypothetical protein